MFVDIHTVGSLIIILCLFALQVTLWLSSYLTLHGGHLVNLDHLRLVTPSRGRGTLSQSASRHEDDDVKTYAQSRAEVEIGWGGGKVVPNPHETNQVGRHNCGGGWRRRAGDSNCSWKSVAFGWLG